MGILLNPGPTSKLGFVNPNPGDATPRRPDVIGPYRLEDQLGAGGMGEVYRAWDERLERWVAVKHIHPQAAGDAKIRRRLRREARAVASLNHPAIVQIYDILETDQGDWIVMELVEGQTLFSLVREKKLSLAQSLSLVSEVAGGLVEAHANGVVHRDLKTENVMVTPAGSASAGRAKILDFGLAKLLHSAGGETILSIHGTIVGTGRAMSPEQAKGEKVDHRSDLFSLGSLLYEVVTGRAPFAGSSIIATLSLICSDEQIPAADMNPQVPEELSLFIDRLLEKDADDRPGNTAEVAATLLDHASRLGARPPEPPLPSPVPREPAAATYPDSWSATEVASGVSIKSLLRITPHEDAHLADHERLAADLLPGSGGVEISEDDGTLLVFERSAAAVAFAAAYQQALAVQRRETGDDLRARIGIHLGEILENGTSAEATARTIVTRTAALGRPGQILMTQGACGMARRALDADSDVGELAWTRHGSYRLPGVRETVRVHEVRPAGAPALPPPPAPARRLGALRRAMPAALVLAAVAFASLAAMSWSPRRPAEAPAVVGSPTVAVKELSNLSGSPESAWLVRAIDELLTLHLTAGEPLRLVADAGAAPDYLVSGSYLSLAKGDEQRLRLQLRLRETRNGETFVHLETAPEGQLFDLVARAQQVIRRQLGAAELAAAEREAVRSAWRLSEAAQ